MKTLEATCQLGFSIPGAWRRPFISPSLLEPQLTSYHLSVSVQLQCDGDGVTMVFSLMC